MAAKRTEIALDSDKVDAASTSHFLDYPRTWMSDKIEAFIDVVGGLLNWVWLLLVLIIVSNVAMRYVLSVNYVWIEEIQWHIYAVGFMMGIGYTIRHDGHVRVEVIADTLSPRTRAVIEFLGIALFILPLIVLMIIYAIPFVERAWTRNEVSSAPGGLSNRWAIKAVIIVAFGFMGMAAFARLLRVAAFLRGRRAMTPNL